MKGLREIDYIIVGQGLAGSALAMRCCERGYEIMVMDIPWENRSSAIAVGLFNPLTGKKTVKTWLADEIFPCLQAYYREVERLTKTRFFYPKPLYMPFLSIEEQNSWMAKSAEEGYRNYLSAVSGSPLQEGKINDPFGGVTLKQTGYLDTGSYLEAVRAYLAGRGVFQAEAFDADKLQIGGQGLRYGDTKAKRIFFCQGVENGSNRWFKDLPVLSLKGEYLTVQCDWKKDVILNRGVFMVPGNNPNGWRVGSTYNREDRLPQATPGARKELMAKLDQLIRMPYTVTAQHWGVRPTTPDRKPIIGAHPEYDQLVIFNGLGTKGVSLAPYFSEVLIRWVENEGMMVKEADASRFY